MPRTINISSTELIQYHQQNEDSKALLLTSSGNMLLKLELIIILYTHLNNSGENYSTIAIRLINFIAFAVLTKKKQEMKCEKALTTVTLIDSTRIISA